MKKYIYSLFAAVLFLFSAGCSKDDDGSKNIDSGVVGEWRQTKWSNEAYADFDVYVEFLSDGTFNIFQKVETPTFVCYSGDFAVNGAQLSGRYRDGEPWGASYAFELSEDGKTLTMIRPRSAYHPPTLDPSTGLRGTSGPSSSDNIITRLSWAV